MSTGRNTAIRDRDRATIRRIKPPCGICGEDIDYTLKWADGEHGRNCKGVSCSGCVPHPMRFEVDHVVALDNGGTDTLANKQASHRKCNRAKWNKTSDGLEPRTFETWRVW